MSKDMSKDTNYFKSIDLKWALWSRDPSYWREHGHKSHLDIIRRAFAGTRSPVTVYTAPRKEIRSGTVTIGKGQAAVNFVAVWDSPACLVPEDVPDELREDAEHKISEWLIGGEGFRWYQESPVGARIDRTVKARSFKALMGKIDDCEADLICAEQENAKFFDEFCEKLPRK